MPPIWSSIQMPKMRVHGALKNGERYIEPEDLSDRHRSEL